MEVVFVHRRRLAFEVKWKTGLILHWESLLCPLLSELSFSAPLLVKKE